MEPFKLERHFAKYEFKAKYMASSSDAEAMSLTDLLQFDEAASREFGKTWLGYCDSNGIPELREAVAKTYEKISPDQVITHCGAEEPIFNFFHSCFTPGDHIIAHVPSYQSFYSVPKSIGLGRTNFPEVLGLIEEHLKTFG